MTCIEVNELIQRYLDHELDQTESEQLHDHLAHCSECTSFYQRLQQVHLSLESLPKVSLPFSIVDSILPELDRLDEKMVQTPQRLDKKVFWHNKRVLFRTFGSIAAGILLIFSFMQLKDEHRGADSYSGEVQLESTQISNQNTNNQISSEVGKSKKVAIEQNNPDQTTSNEQNIIEKSVAADSSAKGESVQSNGGLNSATQDQENASTDVKDQFAQETAIKVQSTQSSPEQPVTDQTIVDQSVAEKSSTDTQTSSGNENSHQYGITATPPVSTVDGPGAAFTGNEVNVTDMERQGGEFQHLSSPNQAYTAIYTKQSIEIKNLQGETVQLLQVQGDQIYLDLQWISEVELQYTLQTSTTKEIWVLNIKTGASELQREK